MPTIVNIFVFLGKFISNNCSSNKKKEEITNEKITTIKIIDDLRGNVEFNTKVSITKEILNKIYS